MKKASKPYPRSLAPGGYEILYCCRECGCSFPMRTDDYHYCYRCGVRLDWGVILEVNKEWRNKFISVAHGVMDTKGNLDYAERDRMLSDLDKVNQTITDGIPREMQFTEATRRANIKANIKYYLGRGWSRSELIKKGFFTAEDFEIYDTVH